MRRERVAALLVYGEAAADARVDLDMSRDAVRRCEQPRADGVRIEPGVEHALPRGGEAA